MKRLLSVVLCLACLVCLCSCTYNPPEGYTEKHHTYEEVLTYAKTIDPDATVSKSYTDTMDENKWEFREWNAIINGTDCHVSSISERVWNEGFAGGEFAKVFYRIDTDYDYTVIQNILAEKYPNWELDDGLHGKYHQNDGTIFVDLILPEYGMLCDEELERVWWAAFEINSEYEEYAIERKVGFCIPSPGEYWSSKENGFVIVRDSSTYFMGFSDREKAEFFSAYQAKWALLKSGLPIVDEA